VKTSRVSIALIVVCVLGLTPVHATEGRQYLKRSIIASDPIFHCVKQVSSVKNLEVTVVDVGRSKGPQMLVKVVFEGFGGRQVNQDVLEGEKPFKDRAIRDVSCDEAHPRVASQLAPEQTSQGSGTFVLNQTHRSIPLGPMENLVCSPVEAPATETGGAPIQCAHPSSVQRRERHGALHRE